MSDGDRGDRPKFEIKIALILGAILSVVLIGAGLIQHGNYHDTASRNAADYARQANDHIRESCLPLAPQAERQCTEIANNTARQNQREEYDLYSQKAMSLWTAVMGGVGLVGVILTGIGVYLIWQTWITTSGANKILKDAADRERRAWLISDITVGTINIGNGQFTVPVRLKVANQGNLPATNFEALCCPVLTTESEMPNLEPGLDRVEDYVDVSGGRRGRTIFPQSPPEDFLPRVAPNEIEEIPVPIDGYLYVFVGVRLVYQSNEARRTTDYYLRVRPKRSGLLQQDGFRVTEIGTVENEFDLIGGPYIT